MSKERRITGVGEPGTVADISFNSEAMPYSDNPGFGDDGDFPSSGPVHPTYIEAMITNLCDADGKLPSIIIFGVQESAEVDGQFEAVNQYLNRGGVAQQLLGNKRDINGSRILEPYTMHGPDGFVGKKGQAGGFDSLYSVKGTRMAVYTANRYPGTTCKFHVYPFGTSKKEDRAVSEEDMNKDKSFVPISFNKGSGSADGSVSKPSVTSDVSGKASIFGGGNPMIGGVPGFVESKAAVYAFIDQPRNKDTPEMHGEGKSSFKLAAFTAHLKYKGENEDQGKRERDYRLNLILNKLPSVCRSLGLDIIGRHVLGCGDLNYRLLRTEPGSCENPVRIGGDELVIRASLQAASDAYEAGDFATVIQKFKELREAYDQFLATSRTFATGHIDCNQVVVKNWRGKKTAKWEGRAPLLVRRPLLFVEGEVAEDEGNMEWIFGNGPIFQPTCKLVQEIAQNKDKLKAKDGKKMELFNRIYKIVKEVGAMEMVKGKVAGSIELRTPSWCDRVFRVLGLNDHEGKYLECGDYGVTNVGTARASDHIIVYCTFTETPIPDNMMETWSKMWPSAATMRMTRAYPASVVDPDALVAPDGKEAEVEQADTVFDDGEGSVASADSDIADMSDFDGMEEEDDGVAAAPRAVSPKAAKLLGIDDATARAASPKAAKLLGIEAAATEPVAVAAPTRELSDGARVADGSKPSGPGPFDGGDEISQLPKIDDALHKAVTSLGGGRSTRRYKFVYH